MLAGVEGAILKEAVEGRESPANFGLEIDPTPCKSVRFRPRFQREENTRSRAGRRTTSAEGWSSVPQQANDRQLLEPCRNAQLGLDC